MPSTPKNTDRDYNFKVSIASHSRSESSSFRQHEQVDHVDGQHPLSKSESPRDPSRPDYSTTSPPTTSRTPSENRHKFRLGKFKPTWGEKRPDNQPTIHRCCSSPVLTTPVDPLSPTKKKSCLLGKKSSKNLRKIASVPSEFGPTNRPLEKKKSQPLRTQPYEAPYFFPPPMPIEKLPSRGKLRRHTLHQQPVPPLPVKTSTI